MKSLRRQWPWNKGFIRLFLTIPSISGAVAAALLYPSTGSKAMWFLIGIPMSAMFTLIYRAVGTRVSQLIEEHQTSSGEVVESLLVIGKMQSPGIAILRKNELELVPILGERCTVQLAELEVIREGRMLPGKYVWGKRAFILRTPDSHRLAFAVEESVGVRWSPKLHQEVR